MLIKAFPLLPGLRAPWFSTGRKSVIELQRRQQVLANELTKLV